MSQSRSVLAYIVLARSFFVDFDARWDDYIDRARDGKG